MLKDCEINQILKELNGTKNDAQMYKAVKKLNMKQLENPFVFNKNKNFLANSIEAKSLRSTISNICAKMIKIGCTVSKI